METKEFIQRLEALGYEVDGDSNVGTYVYKQGKLLARVDKGCSRSLCTDYIRSSELITKKAFNVLVEYAGTPLNERIVRMYMLKTGEYYVNNFMVESECMGNPFFGEEPVENRTISYGVVRFEREAETYAEKTAKHICRYGNFELVEVIK